MLVLVLGSLAAFAPLAIDMYLPAFSAIAADLGTTGNAVGWTLAVYFVGLALGQIVIGPIADRHGRARPLRAGLAVFVLGSLAAALAPRIELLIAARLVQSLGGAACAVTTRAVVRDLYRGADAARINSRLVLVMGVAPIVAPLAGGGLLMIASWRMIFVALAAVGALAWVAVRATLPETAPGHAPGPRVRVIRGLVSDRGFLTHAAITAACSAALFAYITGAPIVLIEIHHVAPHHFGWFFGSNAAAYIATCQLNVRLLRGHAPRALLRCGIAGVVTASSLLVAGALGAWSLWPTAASYALFMASLGLVLPNAVAIALEHQGARAASAAAWLGALQFSLAAVASAAVSASGGGSALPPAVTMLALTLAAGLLVVGRRGYASERP
ncbi:MAG: multidrug effflux MFS transporter [Kofleriaceae bacterium]